MMHFSRGSILLEISDRENISSLSDNFQDSLYDNETILWNKMQMLYTLFFLSSMRLQRNIAFAMVLHWASQTSPGMYVHSILPFGIIW